MTIIQTLNQHVSTYVSIMGNIVYTLYQQKQSKISVMSSQNSNNNPTSSITLSTMMEMPSILKLPDIVEGGSTVIGRHAFTCQQWVKEVHIPEGYTKIDTGAFDQCFYLRKVTLPRTMTHIEDKAFHQCLRLEEINLEYVKHIGNEAFASKSIGNTHFKNALVKLQSIDLRSIETIGERAFAHCKNNRGSFLNLPNIRTIGKEAFRGFCLQDQERVWCGEHLKSIGGGAFKYSTVSHMSLVDCKNLTTIGVEAFHGCLTLSGFLFPRENKIKQLRNKVFMDCHCLEEINLPEGVTTIGKECFLRCGHLERVAWPASLQRVEMGAFSRCRALVKPSDAVFSQWDFIGANAFRNCKVPPPPLFEHPNVFVEISANKLNSDVCSICRDGFTTAPTCQLFCKHLFHQECAHQWYKRNPTCPNCRAPVTSVAIVLPMNDEDKKRKRPVVVEEPLKRQCQHNAVQQPLNCA